MSGSGGLQAVDDATGGVDPFTLPWWVVLRDLSSSELVVVALLLLGIDMRGDWARDASRDPPPRWCDCVAVVRFYCEHLRQGSR